MILALPGKRRSENSWRMAAGFGLLALVLLVGALACGGGADGETMHHCPMHPTVVQAGPGDCPICGMRLVPVEQDEPPAAPSGHAHQPPSEQWECPMHPSIEEGGPGDCPICGMALVKQQSQTQSHGAHTAPGEVPGYASIHLPGARQQLIGVRTNPVVRKQLSREIRTVATVKTDETRVQHIHSKVSGWIERLEVAYTGQRVSRGDTLFDIYSPELVATQEEYLLALRSLDELGDSEVEGVAKSSRRLVEAARRRLKLWDVPEREIRKLETSREVRRTLTFSSPITGYVSDKWVENGMFVDPGKMLFTIADLSEVWVVADVYEYELSLVKEGQVAELSVSAYPGESFEGHVDYVYPTVDQRTRTAQVRFSFPNPDLRLKPGMYANVSLAVDLGERLAVPEEAILDTGTRQIVFVALGDGWFAPRIVETGVRASGWREVLTGVGEGDSVVTNGNFMIDSESRLKASVAQATSGHNQH